MNDRAKRHLDRCNRVSDFATNNVADLAGTAGPQRLANLNQIIAQLTKAKASQGGGRAAARVTLIEGLRLDIQGISRTAHSIALEQLGFDQYFQPPAQINPAAILTTADIYLNHLIVAPTDDPATQAAKADRIAQFVANGLPTDFATQLQAHRTQIDDAKTAEDNLNTIGHESTHLIPGLVKQSIIECTVLDAIFRNVYKRRPDMLAGWVSAHHLEHAPVSAATKAKRAAAKAAKHGAKPSGGASEPGSAS